MKSYQFPGFTDKHDAQLFINKGLFENQINNGKLFVSLIESPKSEKELKKFIRNKIIGGQCDCACE